MSVNNISVKPINDLSSTPSLQDTDNLLAQTSNGFKKVPISQLKEEVSVDTSAFTPTTLLKDTVGWTGKNLIPYPYVQSSNTINGVTFTDNGDGTITANGTATAICLYRLNGKATGIEMFVRKGTYVLSGCPEGGGGDTWRIFIHRSSDVGGYANDNGDGIEFTFDDDYNCGIVLRIASGTTVENLTFYPMLRRADIADDTWEPYHESVEEVVQSKLNEDYANLYGAKNLIPYPYYETTHTESGITFTDNGDGTITANGTATKTCYFELFNWHNGKFPVEAGKKYILSLQVANGTASVYFAHYDSTHKNLGEFAVRNTTSYGEIEFTAWTDDYDHSELAVYVSTSYGKLTNCTIKPMLRLASIKDDTWVPYAKTNKQLTEDVKKLEAYEFETLEAAQAAVQAGEVPDKAIVYVKEGDNVDSMGFSIVDGMLCQSYETEV